MSENKAHKLEPEKWLDRYGDYLFTYALVRLNDEEKSADLVQDTFLAALKASDTFQGRAAERTWLTSILKRKVIDVYRKQYASKEDRMSDWENSLSDPDFHRLEHPFKGHWLQGKGPHSHSLLPEGEVEESELAQIIRFCIEHLPPKLASVFVMKLIDESESQDICKELGISASNLWVMLHRARLRMRNCVENNWLQ